MHRFIQICLFYWMLLWLGTGLLLGNLVCLPLILVSHQSRQRFVQRLISAWFRFFLWTAVRLGLMRLDLKGLDALNHSSRMVLVANHPSMIDVILILSRVRQSTCLMKASIRSNLFLGIGAYMAGYVSNLRVDLALRKAIESVRSGSLFLMFPEGTRTTRHPVNVIKPGFALIASNSDAPIQTILIWSNSAYLSKGWKIWKPPQFPLIYKAILGDKINCGRTYSETADQLQAYFERVLNHSSDLTPIPVD